MNKAQIKHMVDRFLGWRLPDNFNPDGGISFARTYMGLGQKPMKHEPSGTNLFDAEQATTMVGHLVEGLPANERWIAELGKLELSERQPDGSYRVAYKMTPIDIYDRPDDRGAVPNKAY